jgi:uncharacterized phiE125 gp8 family phage protein
MGLSLVTAAPVEPISLPEAKVHLHVDDSDSDIYIHSLILAARKHVENVTRRKLVQQTWDYTLPEFPVGDILLPIQPVSSITSVNYVNGSGNTTAFTDFTLISDGPRSRVVPDYNVSWPTTRAHGNAVTVRFVAGYEPSADSPQDYTANIPPDLKVCMKLIIGDLYENRESSTPLKITQLPTLDALMSPYIMRGF